MRRALAILLALLVAPALAEHGTSRDEDPEGQTVPLTGSAPGVLEENSAPPGGPRGGGGGGKKDKDKGAGDQVQSPIRVTGYPLFVFADGPDAPGDRVAREAARTTDRLVVIAKRKVPGARTLVIRPLSLDGLETAWAEARKKNLDATSLVSAAMVVVNARAAAGYAGGLDLLTISGTVPEAKWRAALGTLSKSIFGEHVPGKSRLETILLLSGAGAIDCRRFPGPVFGMTPAGIARKLAALDLWVQRQEGRGNEVFPLGAREWYDGWNITRKIAGEDYFFCPTPSPKGYLGYKNSPDPHGRQKYGW